MLIAFPLKLWMHEGASVLRYAYIACLVLSYLRLQYCERRLLASSCLSVRIGQLNSNRTYVHKILY